MPQNKKASPSEIIAIGNIFLNGHSDYPLSKKSLESIKNTLEKTIQTFLADEVQSPQINVSHDSTSLMAHNKR